MWITCSEEFLKGSFLFTDIINRGRLPEFWGKYRIFLFFKLTFQTFWDHGIQIDAKGREKCLISYLFRIDWISIEKPMLVKICQKNHSDQSH